MAQFLAILSDIHNNLLRGVYAFTNNWGLTQVVVYVLYIGCLVLVGKTVSGFVGNDRHGNQSIERTIDIANHFGLLVFASAIFLLVIIALYLKQNYGGI